MALFIIIVVFIAGIFIGKVIFCPKVVGSLRIDTSDPDSPPYLFAELTDRPVFKHGELICLRVKLQNYVTQK